MKTIKQYGKHERLKGERQTDRHRDRETETETQRDTERQRQTDSQRELVWPGCKVFRLINAG